MENHHGAVHAQQALCSPLSPCEPSVVWVTHQTISQQLPFGLSKIFIPSLPLAILPSEPSCCFTCFPCWLTHVVFLPLSVSPLDPQGCYLLIFLQLHHCLMQRLRHLPFSQKNFLLQNLLKSAESWKVFNFLSLPLSHALFLIPAWLKRTMTALDVMLWSWMVSKRISCVIEISANMLSAPQLQRLSDKQPCSKKMGHKICE